MHDYGYPHPDDLAPEIEQMLREDEQRIARLRMARVIRWALICAALVTAGYLLYVRG